MPVNYARLYNILMKLYASLPYTWGHGLAFAPLRISIFITYRCNLRCQMCFQREWRKQSHCQDELDFDEIIGVIEQTPRYTLLTWTGGEPFVRPDMLEILRYATRRNPCNILTNGTLLGEPEIKVLLDGGVRLVGISIDGTKEKHDEIRGKPGSFQKTVLAVQELQEYKAKRKKQFPLVDIKTTILPANVDQLLDIFELATQLKADFFTLSLAFGDLQFSPSAIPDISAIFKSSLSPGKMNFDVLSSHLLQMSKSRSNTYLRFYPKLDARGIANYCCNQFDPQHYLSCKLPWSHLWLSPIGQVFPCLSYEIGSVRTQGLSQMLNNQRFRAFRQIIKRFGVVPGCAGCCYLEQK